ncbi:MAG: UDP-galactopyranose mutase [Bifidobacteriaceae bacterium]|jgi:UDP-galactopyranose mutase|nr:UDP-galactopyranose mutase [Bifidobacteriaceae bacterium]
MVDLIIVGAGLFGLTVARQLADQRNIRVKILEKRPHIGGNCWTYFDDDIEVHQYGSHIFHTSDSKVWDFVRKFTDFNDYYHEVWANHHGEVYSMPINLGTINQFFRNNYNPESARTFLAQKIQNEKILNPQNLEEKAVSLIGRELYEAFIRDYTAKQWQTDPKLLSSEIITRLPVRYTYDNAYFDDSYQGIPRQGYTQWFERMLDHPKIEVELNSNFACADYPDVPILYTGPIDRFYDYQYGELGWRTIDFEFEKFAEDLDWQGCAVMNYSDLTEPWTRIIEFKHFHPETPIANTIIAREFSRSASIADDPYYPINTPNDRKLFSQYRKLADQELLITFGGRLGNYRYFDMDDTIAAALELVHSNGIKALS